MFVKDLATMDDAVENGIPFYLISMKEELLLIQVALAKVMILNL
jgi:hypothetical protein